MHKQRLAILIAAGVGLLGLLMPWASVTLPFFGKISQNGFQSGWIGWLTVAAIGAAAGMVFKEADRTKAIDNATQKIVLAAGGALAFFPLLAVIIFSTSSTYQAASIGFGLFLCIIAGLAIVAIPFAIKDSGEISMPNKQSISDEINQMRNDS